jgi:hypothetical protein
VGGGVDRLEGRRRGIGEREGARVSSGDPRVTSGCTNLKHWKLVGKKLPEVI